MNQLETINGELEKMGYWEGIKATYLLHILAQMKKMDGHIQIGVNPYSGYTWVYSENDDICLYMPISCELRMDDVYILYSCPEDGEEIETELGDKELWEVERFYKVCRYLSERKTR